MAWWHSSTSGVTASNLLSQNGAAASELKDSQRHRNDAAKALGQAALTLTSDEAAESRDLAQLIEDVATLEHAGACATVTITPPPSTVAATPGSTTATTTTTVPSTTTTTVPSTTTTTVPSTTTTLPTGIPLDSPAPPTTTTTTVPPTTTTTVQSTTTTTLPAAALPATATPPPAEADGVPALQGCIATFAPPASA